MLNKLNFEQILLLSFLVNLESKIIKVECRILGVGLAMPHVDSHQFRQSVYSHAACEFTLSCDFTCFVECDFTCSGVKF